jgi:hypothetical protein
MEVALAATVMALTLVGMISVIESGSQMLDLSRKQTIATQIIHDEIDQLRLEDWTVVSAIPSTYTTVAISPVFTSPLGSFTCKYKAVQVSDLSGNAIAMMQVSFLVSWKGINGLNYSRTGTTLISQNGLLLANQRS